jgi:hypothetical protein
VAAKRWAPASLSLAEDLSEGGARVGVVVRVAPQDGGDRGAEVPAAAPGVEPVALVVGLDQLRLLALALEVAVEEEGRVRSGSAW